MWVSASTDYAIRMLICLADAAGPVSSSKLARMIGVSTRYLLQIGARLRDAGMITVTYGSSGGYKLSLPPEEICLLDIIMLMERRAEQSKLLSAPMKQQKRDFSFWSKHIGILEVSFQNNSVKQQLVNCCWGNDLFSTYYIDICVRAAVSYERPDSCQPLMARQTIKLFIGFRENQSVCVIF